MPMGEKSEEEFQAESDVRTLAEAMEIRADSARFDRAMKMADEKMKKLEELKESNG